MVYSAEASSIQVNKLAGDTVRNVISIREAPAAIEQIFSTVGGARVVDVVTIRFELTAIESKVGRTALDSRVRQELARDWWLLRRGGAQGGYDRAVWEFSPSEVTGKLGPTGPLQKKLEKLGVEIRINEATDSIVRSGGQ